MKEEQSHVEQMMGKLPIARHFKDGLQSTIEEASNDKGKAIALMIKLGIFATIGYFSWVYILPTLFTALGNLISVVAVGAGVIASVILVPWFVKKMQAVAKKLKKRLINEDPFGELAKQELGILENQKQARMAHGQIKQLENDMHLEAQANEKSAEQYQMKIISNAAKAKELQAKLTEMEQKFGPSEAKGMDEYVNANTALMKLLMSGQRLSSQLEQAQNFVMKYGTRASVMKKVSHKLTMVEAMMDEKVLDFRATVEILKKDFEFASKSREATDAAKKAMLFDKTWELEYALDAVTTRIASDIAQTSGNFKDISLLTSNFDMDSDEMFASLDKLATDIQQGSNVTPDASKYNRSDYELTQKDRQNSGGFGELF